MQAVHDFEHVGVTNDFLVASTDALALRYALLRPGPDLAMVRPENGEAQGELLDPPSVAALGPRRRNEVLDEEGWTLGVA